MKIKNLLLVYCFFLFISIQAEKTDIMIFSCNKPLQLEALLSSVDFYVKSYDTIFVLYRAEDPLIRDGYALLKKMFPFVMFIKQSKYHQRDFKMLLVDIIYKKSISDYMLFLVDDFLFTSDVDCNQVVDLIVNNNALACFLYLGNNIRWNYDIDSVQPLPEFATDLTGQALIWSFCNAVGQFNIPYSFIGTFYNKELLKDNFFDSEYQDLVSLTESFQNISPKKDYGLSYVNAKGLRLVPNSGENDVYLNEYFLNGYKFDISDLKNKLHNTYWYEYTPSFILYT